MPLVAFSPRKAATILYNVRAFEGSESLLTGLGKHTTGKGCLYIRRLAEVDKTVLEAMVVNSIANIRARYPK